MGEQNMDEEHEPVKDPDHSEELLRATRRSMVKGAAALGLYSAGTSAASAATTWTVTGPNDVNEARLRLDAGELSLQARHDGTTMIDYGRVGIETSSEDFTVGLSFEGSADWTESETYTTASGNQLSHEVDANVTRFTFSNVNGAMVDIDVWVNREGVAYRYVLDGSGDVTVTDEASTFSIPDALSPVWTMNLNSSSTAQFRLDNYESLWFQTTASAATGDKVWGSLFEVTDSDYLLLAEADVTGRYGTTHLTTSAGSTTWSVTFPAGDFFEADRPLETPWRVGIFGDLPSLVEGDIMTDLNDSSEINDASWIEPGRSSWSWWSDGTVDSFSNQKKYVDFAMKHGWEYHLVDNQWTDDPWIRELIDYAETVDIVLWTDHADIDTASKRQDRFPSWKEWGAAGIKADFFDDDSQSMMQVYDGILEDAAANELACNFHGSTLPKGLRRKWPHLLTYEAVLGAEFYRLFVPIPVEHITILPFTRNVLGSMDYTPVTFSADTRLTTAGFELALSIVQESGQMHYADDVDEYENWPNAVRFLDTAAAAWVETHLVDGYPMDRAVIARQKPDSSLWHVGAIANNPQTLGADLSFLDSGTTYDYELYRDDGDGGIEIATGTATDSDTISQSVADNGGFTILLYPQDGTAPSVPSSLVSPSSSSSRIDLAWDGSTDSETEVHHYNIYVDGSKHEEWASTYARIDGVDAETIYDVSVTAVDVAGNESDASDTISVSSSVEGFRWVDVTGAGDAHPFADPDTDSYAITAAGKNIWKNHDQYAALYRANTTGETSTFVTEIESQEDTSDGAMAGLMVANDITAPGTSAGDVLVSVTPDNGFKMAYDADGDGYVDTKTKAGTTSYPCKLRLEKEGTTFTGEYSTDDGASWTTIDSVDVAASDPGQDAGMFVCSHNSGTGGTVEFGGFYH